jgi:hypothetical protein
MDRLQAGFHTPRLSGVFGILAPLVNGKQLGAATLLTDGGT